MRRLVQCALLFFIHFKAFEKNIKKMEFTLKKNFIEEEKVEKFVEECEKVKLFDELIQIDGKQWRQMMAELTKKEYEDQQRRFKEIIREEQEDWDRHLEEVGKRLEMIKFFEELPRE